MSENQVNHGFHFMDIGWLVLILFPWLDGIYPDIYLLLSVFIHLLNSIPHSVSHFTFNNIPIFKYS